VDGPPCKSAVAVVDVLTGMYASNAVLAALHARTRTGHGYAIDLALADCALAAQVNVAQAYLTSGTLSPRQGNSHLQIVPYQLFATADGWLVLNVGNDSQWKEFCRAADAPELGADPRFATNRQRVERRAEVIPLIEAAMTRFTTAEWGQRLAHVPHAVVRNYADVFRDPQTLARNMKLTVRDPNGTPVDLIGNPVHLHGAPTAEPTMPPRLGEQTERVLSDLLGLSGAEVRALKAKGVV
jgi:crotonobetainyl-CoA:carnitine CoA-transferase CaiB-like acyl-CoA transferase